MPSWLANEMRSPTITTCEAFRYVNASPVSLGTFGLDITGSISISGSSRNAIIQFQGQIYALANDGIYQKDDPTVDGGTWTVALTFVSPQTSNRDTYWGIYPVEVGGVLHLVGVRPAGGGAVAQARWFDFDGTTWTEAPADINVGSPVIIADSTVYRGLVLVLAINGLVQVYDPGSQSFSSTTVPIGVSRDVGSFCVFDDRLFVVTQDVGANVRVYEYAAGFFVLLASATGPLVLSSVVYTSARWGAFTDGTYMYAMITNRRNLNNNSDAGWTVLRWDSSMGTPVDISATVLPSVLRPVNDGGSWPAGTTGYASRALIFYDQETAPGTGDIYIGVASSPNNGTPITLYKWNGNAALMTSVDTGGNIFHAFSTSLPQGGCRTFVPGELDVKIVSRVGVLGGEQITFRAYGGGTGRKFKLLYSIGGDPDLLEATLTGPVTGGSATLNTGLNQVEGVAADGVTSYTIVWDTAADGIAPGTILDRFPLVAV